MADNNLIRQILFELCIPPHMSGYSYLIAAIRLVSQDFSYIRDVTKRLYPEVAREFGSTPQRVERSMRNAIESGTTRCPIETLTRYFGRSLNPKTGKPTNSHFIAMAAELVIDERAG